LAELYRRHAGSGIRLAYLLTGEEALAEDLFHDAFVRLAGRWTTLRDPDAFGAYLRRTIVNLSHSHFRRRRVERRYVELEARNPLAASEKDPFSRVDDRLWEQIQQLPAGQRAAVVLRFYEDLSDAEIADVLGCRPGTVRSRISRALEELRTIRGGERVGD
jgi:RNA polymerase sigma-70 factor (sigma-E family)